MAIAMWAVVGGTVCLVDHDDAAGGGGGGGGGGGALRGLT